MRIKSIIFVFFILLISCKSKISPLVFKSLTDYYLSALKNNKIELDAILVENNILIGNYSNIELNKLKYKSIESKSIQIVPKGYSYLNEYFGKNAENGILVINNTIAFHCGGYYPEKIFILDNEKVSLEELEKNNIKCYFVAEFKGIKNKDNKYVEITILSIHKQK